MTKIGPESGQSRTSLSERIERSRTLAGKRRDICSNSGHWESRQPFHGGCRAEGHDGSMSTRSEAAESESLSRYLDELAALPLLDEAEERALGYAAARGEADDRRRLIEGNLRLVVSIARRHLGLGLSLADLVQEGNLGLIHAVGKYDSARHCRFSTYAYRWILKAVDRALDRAGHALPLPAAVADSVQAMVRTEAWLTSELGRPATISEVADEMDLSPDRLKYLRQLRRAPLSLELSLSDDGGLLAETIADTEADDPLELTCAHFEEQEFVDLLAGLEPRERTVLWLRYGLGDRDPQSYRQIGEQLGLSRETIRKTDHDTVERLVPNRERGLATDLRR